MKKRIYILTLFTISCFTVIKIQAETSILSLQIAPGTLTIAQSGTITLPAITTSGNSQTIQATLSPNTFVVQDKMGSCSGYSSSLQIGHLSNGGATINAANITLQAAGIQKIAGSDNPAVTIGNAINKAYIYRPVNQGCRSIGKYTNTPTIQVTVPANTPSGNYRGTVFFLLYSK